MAAAMSKASTPTGSCAPHPGWRVLNRGINGERADQIRARFARDVETQRPHWVILLAGVNDVYQDRPLKDAEADLLWIYRRRQIVGDRPHRGQRAALHARDGRSSKRLAELNSWIKAAAKHEKIPFCDAAHAVADPKDPRRLKGSPDGLHPDVAGYRALGEALAKSLEKLP